MPINPSIPLGIRPPQVNALQSFGQFANLGRNLLEQRALGQQIQSNVAASNALRSAIDPTTGQIDYNKFTTDLANSGVGYNLPQIQSQILQQQLTKQQLTNQQWDLLNKQNDAIRQTVGGLLARPSFGPQDVIKSVASLVSNGMLSPQAAANALSTMPTDPTQIRSWVMSHAAAADRGAQLLTAVKPTIEQVNSGGFTTLVPMAPLTGQPVGTPTVIRNTMTPGEASQTVQVFDPATGTTRLISRAQFAAGNAAGGGTPVSGASPTTSASSAPGFQASPALGQEDIAKAAAKRYNDLSQASQQAPIAINGYDRALDVLQNTTSGPGASTGMLITGALNSFGLPVAKNTTENFQTLKKYLANAASQAASASGYSGSDARFDAFQAGQPNPEHMNPEALGDAIRYVRALQQGVVAKFGAEQSYLNAHGGNTSALPQFEEKWSKAFDPDVMELRSLSPSQQVSYIGALSDAKRAKLTSAYKQMHELGAF